MERNDDTPTLIEVSTPDAAESYKNDYTMKHLMACNIPHWRERRTEHPSIDEITYPFSTFNDATVEISEWISNFITRFTGHVIT